VLLPEQCNIGYVYFDRFYPTTEEAKATIQSVFNFLKNTNALIIDVRNNGGGDPEMVSYICSFLFTKQSKKFRIKTAASS